MRTFLAAFPEGKGAFRVDVVAEPHACLADGGVVSPIFGAFGGDCPAASTDGAILLLFPKSPRAVLFRAQSTLPDDLTRRFFVSHGLASVGVMLNDVADHPRLVEQFRDILNGYELWPLTNSRVDAGAIVHEPGSVSGPVEGPLVADSGLPFDAAAQVRQFNANIAFVAPKIAVYAYEYTGLISWLRINVELVASEIRALHPQTSAIDVQLQNDATARLVELNAGLTMLTSQLLSGTHPLLRHDHPVAEYSLLGIGGMSRGIWSLYLHLSNRVARASHLERLSHAFDIGAPFPIFMNRQSTDFSQWETSKVRLEVLPEIEASAARLHILYFSSRYGFHETLNTMSASWQCVHSSATRDWNLLTLSHEFLHSQVRDLLTCILDGFTYDDLAAIIRNDAGNTAWEAAAGALVSAMLHCDRVRRDLPYISKDHPSHLSPGWRSDPSGPEIGSVIEGQSRRYVQEIIVHTLDYLYVYDSRDDAYIRSIWGSWTFVPAVIKRVRHYTVRSLVALAARSAAALDPLEAFNDARTRLIATLAELVQAADNPVVSAALALFDDEDEVARLNVEFDQAHYLVRFARTFLFDPRTARALQSDENLVVSGSASAPSYGLDVGTIPDFSIASPTEFLLDRFTTFPSTPTDGSRSYESLWQVLLLVGESQPE